ncbi:MAG: hypothetical protein ACKO40_09570 [Planctomycetaceae bacterium]
MATLGLVLALVAGPRESWAQPPGPAAAVPVVAARVATMQAASGQPFVGTVVPAGTCSRN